MFGNDLYTRLAYGLASPSARDELQAIVEGGYPFSTHWYVDASRSASGDGRSPQSGFLTMEEAFAVVGDNDVIHLRGPIFEHLTAPDGVTGVTIIGDGSGLRHGSTSNVAEGFAPAWRKTSDSSPLLQVHSQGWRIANILFQPGDSDTAIEILSDGAADPEHTVSGLGIYGCRFGAAGLRAIEDNGGSGFVEVIGNHFYGQTGCSIINTSTSNALPLAWRIENNRFGGASAAHIDMPLSKAFVHGNVFGTVASTGIYVDLTSGANNMVTGNYLAGVYNTSDYVAGTSDLWLGNWVTVVSTQAPNGFSILAPAAP